MQKKGGNNEGEQDRKEVGGRGGGSREGSGAERSGRGSRGALLKTADGADTGGREGGGEGRLKTEENKGIGYERTRLTFRFDL